MKNSLKALAGILVSVNVIVGVTVVAGFTASKVIRVTIDDIHDYLF